MQLHTCKKMASNKKLIALVLAENVYENLELHYPRLRLQEAGLNVLVVAPEAGKIYTSKEGYPVTSDCDFKSVDPAQVFKTLINVLIFFSQVAVIVVPGGFAPDKLRRYKECLELVSNCVKNGACVGSICHGPWVLIRFPFD